jgi:hypothetical protein
MCHSTEDQQPAQPPEGVAGSLQGCLDEIPRQLSRMEWL